MDNDPDAFGKLEMGFVNNDSFEMAPNISRLPPSYHDDSSIDPIIPVNLFGNGVETNARFFCKDDNGDEKNCPVLL